MADSCPSSLDNVWGLQVDTCRRIFDFTLLFEQSILSLLPSAIFLSLSLIRLWRLRAREARADGGVTKQVLNMAMCGLSLALVVLWSRNSKAKTASSIPMASMLLAANFVMVPLSWLEHTRTIKPSALLCTYLVLSTILDAVQVRTLWMMRIEDGIPIVFSILFAVRILLLGVECRQKKTLVHPGDFERSPEDRCSVISRSFFLWLLPLVYAGHRGVIDMDDLYPPPVDVAPESLERKLQKAWSQSSPKSKHRLLVATAQVLKGRLLAPVIPRLFMVGLMVIQPVLLLRLINYLDEKPQDLNKGYGLIGAYALVYVGIAVANAWYFHQTFKFLTAARAGLVALVYDQTTKLSTSAMDKSSAVTVMSADIERIVGGLKTIHDIWANAVQVALAAWLLERQTGIAVVVPLVIAAACGYSALLIGGAAGKQQVSWLSAMEKRIEATTSTLSSMRAVKLSGLTDKLADMIQALRVAELDASSRFRWWQVAALVTGFVPVMISPVLTFAVFIAIANAESEPLDAARMFVSLSFLTLMSQPLSMLFQSGPALASMVACFDRIGKFIETEKWDDPRDQASMEKVNVTITNAQFSWDKDAKPVLRNVNVTLPWGKLTMVIGPVGCGKSTLLKGILGEVPYTSGTITLSSQSMAFCDQTSWLMNGTFKENIVSFSDPDDPFYHSVLHACALDEDIAHFSDGDQSNVGSKGITLSGGQKQRLCLARALFSRKQINVFDDVFSGLDATTEMLVFARVFGPNGLLRRNGQITIVLATNAVHLLPFADHIVCIGPEGDVAEQGTFSELNKREQGYVGKLGIQPNQKLVNLDNVDRGLSESSTTNEAEKAMKPSEEAEKPRGVFRYYIKAIGPWMAVLYLVLVSLYAFLYNFPYIWAKWWTDENAENPGGHAAYYVGIYALLQVMCLVLLVMFAWHAIITIVKSSGISLHWSLVSTALRAPLSFFEKTDTGITLNRFSQDLQMTDNELPLAALNLACSGLIVLGQLLLIMNTSYWLALSFPAILLVLWVLQTIYLRTSRQLRHMELEAKSPLYSQFVESLDGLASIRAFGWQVPLKRLLYERLDKSQRPFYLFMCLQRWLSNVLDCLAAGFILILIGLVVGLRDRISSGFAGVAMSNTINLGMILTHVIEVWTQVETSITSVQRIRDFERDTPSETKDKDLAEVTSTWPDEGAIEIRDLVATYRDGTIMALRDVTMDIKPGEKIGICGRTGSGKTSLMLSLFGMVDVAGGYIRIDGQDIAHVDPNTLRARLNAIPQDPYLISGTIRVNADPYSHRSTDEILRALEAVHLGPVIQSKGGLEATMEQDTLSHGERQLFCLARAMLRRSKVVVLDEATSNIDIQTEKLIRNVIRHEFKDCTVITIAHRLESIISCDRIAVLDAGMLVELDSPANLLEKPVSRFKALYETYKRE